MGYPIFHSQYTAAQIEASIGKTPRIKSSTRTWEIWDIATSAYVDTGVSIDTELFVDNTLTEAGYAADAKATGDKLGELKSAITLYTGNASVEMSDPANKNYISIPDVGETVSLTPATGSVYPYRYGIMECVEGDVFYVTAKTTAGIYCVGFADADNKILSRYGSGGVYNGGTFKAPANAAKVIINSYEGGVSYKGPYLVDEVGQNADSLQYISEILNESIEYNLKLEWIDGKYIVAGNGAVGTSSSMACTDYVDVIPGQKLLLHVSAYGSNECGVAYYNTGKTYIQNSSKTSDGETVSTVPDNAVYARFSTKKAQISVADAYIRNIVSSDDDLLGGFAEKKYYVPDSDQFVTDETVKPFVASSPRLDYRHKGEVTPNSRFMAIGFDDFRTSDFNMIIPLFEKYSGKATFNRPITSNDDLTNSQKNSFASAVFGAHEVGDHTILHYAFPYEDALFNGQNPSSVDGSQTPYPTNAQMRNDAGGGRNAFYLLLTAKVKSMGLDGIDSTIGETEWGNLTDAQCQTIRETFSAMKNPVLAPLLDAMSNYYLGTTGTSAGSWDNGTGKYTGGIFTGCATSANHEIWERILTIVQMYYKEKCGLNGDLLCWSWPGEHYFGRGFSSNGYIKYYDSALTVIYNMNARFESSLYKDELGTAKVRSFTDVLREFGYKYTHDYIYPSRLDYLATPAMRKQFFFNEHLSKEDGVLYPTDRTVTYSAVNTAYPSTFFTTGKTKAAQMYDGGGVFYNFIEALRHDTAHGLIHGEVIDSTDSYSMKIFFEEALRFCKSAGIEVITKAEAYDVCFNHPIENGNLIYNPSFRNSAAEFFTDSTSVPTNPDGYSGSCSVTADARGNILVTTGETTYIHYGIPLGKIKYSADVKGTGTITIYLIKCGDNENLSSLTQLTQISIDSASDFTEKTASAVVPNNPMTAWSQRLEGLDNKVMGLKIVYSTGLQIKNIRLVKE